MEYHATSPENIVDVWSRAFEALSINQCTMLWRDLGFSLPPSHDLRMIAQSFALSHLIYLGKEVPEQPVMKLLDTSQPDEPLMTLWNNTFFHLQRIGYADNVYRWGRQIYTNYSDQNNQVVQELDWDALLTDWAHNSIHPNFASLPFSSQTIVGLQSIIIRYNTQAGQLRLQLEQLKQSPKNAWEQFAFETLQIGSWMHNQAQFMVRVNKWNEIFDLLSDTDIRMLETWGWQHFEKVGVHTHTPLVLFTL